MGKLVKVLWTLVEIVGLILIGFYFVAFSLGFFKLAVWCFLWNPFN